MSSRSRTPVINNIFHPIYIVFSTVETVIVCPVEEYRTGEGSLPVCNSLDDSNWESSFFAQVGQEEPEEEDDDQGE